jgi:hypothetical protein
VGGLWGGEAPLLTKVLKQVHNLSQAVECEQMQRAFRGRRHPGIIRRAHRQGGVGAIRQLHDEVGVSPVPDTDNGDPLAA